MGKVIKQHASQKHGQNVSSKLTGREAYSHFSAPFSSRVKTQLSKLYPAPSTRYIVIHVNPDLANQGEQKQVIKKVEEAKALFANYRASK